MRIAIAGGTGFLGTALTRRLVKDGHQVVILTRRLVNEVPAPGVSYLTWLPNGTAGSWATEVGGADAVINLAGESIAAKRWTTEQKKRIRRSRIDATRSLTAAILGAARPPQAFLSGSAVGFYGDRGDETLTEASPAGSDFLAEVCQEWEAAALDVAHVARVVLIRTGIVLDRREGALAKMLPPFLIFAGGPLGSGRQFMPWIHRDDWVRLVAWALGQNGARGPLNATAPTPVTNAEFSRALGRALKRPSLLPAPAFALKIALGELADALLLSGQRALPVRATDLGFSFRFANIDEALVDVLKKDTE
jgi:uncharacterized protein (TIGR01777 family)